MNIRWAVMTLLFAATLSAQDRNESTAREWVKAFNSGSAETMEAFATSHFAPALLKSREPAARKTIYEQVRANEGDLRVTGILASDTSITLRADASRGGQIRLTFEFDANGLISRLAINKGGDGDDEAPSNLPPLVLPANVTAAQLSPLLDAYLKNLERSDSFWGVVLVAKGDEVWFENAYGYASKRFAIRNTPKTRFDVGSITKDFTKIAIMQLAQQGKLALTDTAAKHLPDYPNKEIAAKITIQQLLDHSSGLGDVFTQEYSMLNRLRLRKISDYFPIYADDPLLFEPGTSRRYSNYGYIVLGAIVEAVSGENYYDYVKKHIFDPAGMTQSAFFEADRITPDLAIGHTRRLPGGAPASEMMENTLRLPVRGASDGGSHSTARDLLRFDRALRKGALLNPQWTGRYFGDSPATAVVAAAGGAPGVNAVIASDGTWSVVVVSNTDPRTGEDLGERVIYNALRGRKAT